MNEKSSQPMADDVEFVLGDCEWLGTAVYVDKGQDMTKMLIDRSVVEQAFEALAGTDTDKKIHRAQYKLEKAALIGLLNALSTGDKLAPVETPAAKPAEQEPVGEVVEVAQCYDERWTAIIETGSVELQKGDKVYTTPQPTIPPGYKLVPVEPTPEMRQAVCNCHDIDHQEQIVEDYRAMLAAAPKAPQPSKREPLTGAQIRKWWASENGLEDCDMAKLDDFEKVVRAIEAAHGIGGQT